MPNDVKNIAGRHACGERRFLSRDLIEGTSAAAIRKFPAAISASCQLTP